jgi:hypothetical protein
MNTSYIVNFFTQRDYERIPSIIEAGANEIANDPKSFGERKR